MIGWQWRLNTIIRKSPLNLHNTLDSIDKYVTRTKQDIVFTFRICAGMNRARLYGLMNPTDSSRSAAMLLFSFRLKKLTDSQWIDNGSSGHRTISPLSLNIVSVVTRHFVWTRPIVYNSTNRAHCQSLWTMNQMYFLLIFRMAVLLHWMHLTFKVIRHKSEESDKSTSYHLEIKLANIVYTMWHPTLNSMLISFGTDLFRISQHLMKSICRTQFGLAWTNSDATLKI